MGLGLEVTVSHSAQPAQPPQVHFFDHAALFTVQ